MGARHALALRHQPSSNRVKSIATNSLVTCFKTQPLLQLPWHIPCSQEALCSLPASSSREVKLTELLEMKHVVVLPRDGAAPKMGAGGGWRLLPRFIMTAAIPSSHTVPELGTGTLRAGPFPWLAWKGAFLLPSNLPAQGAPRDVFYQPLAG